MSGRGVAFAGVDLAGIEVEGLFAGNHFGFRNPAANEVGSDQDRVILDLFDLVLAEGVVGPNRPLVQLQRCLILDDNVPADPPRFVGTDRQNGHDQAEERNPLAHDTPPVGEIRSSPQ
jgi:hypothetical protein